ncbi:MAG: hypothetical protein ACKO9Q_15170, partial [Pirellula sp.]
SIYNEYTIGKILVKSAKKPFRESTKNKAQPNLRIRTDPSNEDDHSISLFRNRSFQQFFDELFG